MPRPYQTGTGASMSGRTYEPQVTPWDRSDDDFDVYEGSTYDRDRQASGRSGQDDTYGPSAGERHYAQDRYRPDNRGNTYRQNDGQDAYTRRDLQPTYQDAYERDRERYGRDEDHRAYQGAIQDRDYDRDLVGNRYDNRDRDDRREPSREDRPWTGFASGYDRRR